MENKPYIVRRSIPHEYDEAPYGTLCKVVITNEGLSEMINGWKPEEEWYKQISKDAHKPRWEKIS